MLLPICTRERMRVAANQVLQDLVNGFCLAVAFTRTRDGLSQQPLKSFSRKGQNYCFKNINNCGQIQDTFTISETSIDAVADIQTGNFKLMIFGGGAPMPATYIEIVDLETNSSTCSDLRPHPWPTTSAFGVLVNDQPMVCGGVIQRIVYSNCSIYSNGAWTLTYPMLSPRRATKIAMSPFSEQLMIVGRIKLVIRANFRIETFYTNIDSR